MQSQGKGLPNWDRKSAGRARQISARRERLGLMGIDQMGPAIYGDKTAGLITLLISAVLMATCLIRWARLQPPELGQVFVIHQNTFRVLMYSSRGKGPVHDISLLH